MITDAQRDEIIITLTAYGESRSEGAIGIRAQIHSVINRHKVGRWYSEPTLAATCIRAFQYSEWNTSDPNRLAGCIVPMSDQYMALCNQEAVDALSGASQDPTGGATHYYAAGTPEPTWVPGDITKNIPPATFCGQIGKHLFYKDVQ